MSVIDLQARMKMPLKSNKEQADDFIRENIAELEKAFSKSISVGPSALGPLSPLLMAIVDDAVLELVQEKIGTINDACLYLIEVTRFNTYARKDYCQFTLTCNDDGAVAVSYTFRNDAGTVLVVSSVKFQDLVGDFVIDYKSPISRFTPVILWGGDKVHCKGDIHPQLLEEDMGEVWKHSVYPLTATFTTTNPSMYDTPFRGIVTNAEVVMASKKAVLTIEYAVNALEYDIVFI